MPSTWRERARACIYAAATEWMRERGWMALAFEKLDAEQRAELYAHVNAAYPWGPRSNHPYHAWLTELKAFRGVVEVYFPRVYLKRTRTEAASLFDAGDDGKES